MSNDGVAATNPLIDRDMKRRTLLTHSIMAAGAAKLGMPVLESQAASGFYMPDEAQTHERTFMQWPVSREVHPDPIFLRMLQASIARIANAISEFEPVVMLMDKSYRRSARRKLGSGVTIWDIPTDDLWCRDAGPIFVVTTEGELAVAHIAFNGWGGKQTHAHDAQIAKRVAERLSIPLIETDVVGEGGGVETDGEGTLLAHESSWVNPNRNRADRATIERRLLAALGAEKMLWAPGVKGADITDYHIDALARFVEPGVVVIQLPNEPDAHDPWSAPALETAKILEQATDARGRRLKIATLPEPTQTRIRSDDFVAAYVNYYVCNGGIIAPEFGDRVADAKAAATLRAFYPDHELVMLNVDPIGETGGGIHCATQQQPKV